MLSLVIPGFEPVTNLLWPSIVLIKDDFPAFGFPINEILIWLLLFIIEGIIFSLFLKFSIFISELYISSNPFLCSDDIYMISLNPILIASLSEKILFFASNLFTRWITFFFVFLKIELNSKSYGKIPEE